jgi:hypothetical protein
MLPTHYDFVGVTEKVPVVHRDAEQSYCERKKQDVTEAPNPKRDVDGKSDTACDSKTCRQHASSAVDTP